jgi:hypothetical protein
VIDPETSIEPKTLIVDVASDGRMKCVPEILTERNFAPLIVSDCFSRESILASQTHPNR